MLVEAGEAAPLLGRSATGVLLTGRREYFMMVLIYLCYSVVWSVKAVFFLRCRIVTVRWWFKFKLKY